MKLIRVKSTGGSEYAIAPTSVAWFTDDDIEDVKRTFISLIGGASLGVYYTVEEFAQMWEDAMRADEGAK